MKNNHPHCVKVLSYQRQHEKEVLSSNKLLHSYWLRRKKIRLNGLEKNMFFQTNVYIYIYMLSVLKVTFSNHRSYKVYMHWNRDHVFICDAVCRAKLKLLGWITYIYVLIGHTPNIHEHIQSNLKKS